MEYYVIRPSRDLRIIGHYPQTKDVKQNCDVLNELKFIEHSHFQKIDFLPITANAILHNSSNVTDLIDVVGIGFSRKLLISGKLKSLLEDNRKSGLQFFNSDLIYKSDYIRDFWILNIYEVSMELVDYHLSTFGARKKRAEGGTYVERINIKSIEDFNEKLKKKESYGQVFIERIKIIERNSLDFFALLNVEGGVKYVVSEKLKKEMEDSGCTGIEFQPIELTLAEWLHGGERERVYGKA